MEVALSEQFGRPVALDLVVDRGRARGAGGTSPPKRDTHRSPEGFRRPIAPSIAPSIPPLPRPPRAASSPGTAPAPPAAPDALDGPDARPSDAGTPGTRKDKALDGGHDPDDQDDPSVFDETELGEVAEVDNSAEARVLQAFPGAEEVG